MNEVLINIAEILKPTILVLYILVKMKTNYCAIKILDFVVTHYHTERDYRLKHY